MEQDIELFHNGDETITYDGCKVILRYDAEKNPATMREVKNTLENQRAAPEKGAIICIIDQNVR